MLRKKIVKMWGLNKSFLILYYTSERNDEAFLGNRYFQIKIGQLDLYGLEFNERKCCVIGFNQEFTSLIRALQDCLRYFNGTEEEAKSILVKKCASCNLKFDYFEENGFKLGRLYWEHENPPLLKETILEVCSPSDIVSLSTKLSQMFWLSMPLNDNVRLKVISAVDSLVTSPDFGQDAKIDKLLAGDYPIDTLGLSNCERNIAFQVMRSYAPYFVQYCNLRYIAEDFVPQDQF